MQPEDGKINWNLFLQSKAFNSNDIIKSSENSNCSKNAILDALTLLTGFLNPKELLLL